jgi:dolichol-phosphate mannosyltransferase
VRIYARLQIILMHQTVVVIPTKNEEGNITPLFKGLMKLGMPLKIIFVNDPSTDKTCEIEEGLEKLHKNVEVVKREKSEGLGRALLDGYIRAIKSGAEFIAQMDGDGQHDPACLPKLIDAAEKGADVVLGSRYVANGSVGDWGFARRLTSWGANRLVRRMLRGSGVRDATTGYRVFRREMLEKIVESGPGSSGYVFQIDVLARAARLGARIEELPIEFRERRSGKSKLRLNDKKEFMFFALRNMV